MSTLQFPNAEVHENREHSQESQEEIAETEEFFEVRPEEPSIKRKDIIILTVLYLLTVIPYYISLEGGDLEFIRENLNKMVRLLFISVVSFFAFNVVFYKKCTPFKRTSLRFIQFAILIGTFVLFYSMDHGETLENHGLYNLLIFIILFMPAGLVVFSVVAFYGCLSGNSQKNCKRGSFVFLAILLVAMTISLKNNREKFFVGLSGTRMIEGKQVCQPTGWNLPWFDLLPPGANNFWTGSQVCVPLPKYYTASISEYGYLHVKNCSTTPHVIFFPSTKDFDPKNKTYKTMHIHIKDLWIEHDIEDQEKGLKLPEGVEAALVECGADQEKQLLYHIEVQKMTPQRPPVNNTPAANNTRQTSQTQDKRNVQSNTADPKDKPNILMIFIDATSRRQFYRRLPKTIKWLENMKQNSSSHKTQMDVLQFLRYHVVGFNTANNSIAMYCGQNDTRPDFFEHATEDPMCPMWKPFQKEGYSTIVVSDYCEDWSGIYLRNSTSAHLNHEMLAPFCHPDYFEYAGNPFGNFKGPYSILRRCLYGDYVHNHNFNYMEQAMRKYTEAEQPYFMLSSFMEGHEGTGEVLATVDDDLSGFLAKMEREHLLDNTIVVITADHGLHMGINFAFLENGKLEHRYPFLTMLVPSKYNREAIEKLRDNEQKLVTGFDLHHTLLKLPGFRKDGSFEDNVIETLPVGGSHNVPTEQLKNMQKPQPASSLLDDIPWKRTCDEAFITDGYCECELEVEKPSRLAYIVDGMDGDDGRLRRRR